LSKGVITKLLGDTKLVMTPKGCLKTQEVVTMQDLRLPEFDKNRRINQQMVSVLSKGIITKLLGDTKLVRTPKGCLKTQEVVTMQDLRLPEFNKNRRINQQMVLVLDNNNAKYNIILDTNFLSKKWNQVELHEGIWNGLITPSTFVHLVVWIQKNLMPWKICSTYKSKTSSLVKMGSNALQPRFWTQTMRKQM
jgi:hypothetical protein